MPKKRSSPFDDVEKEFAFFKSVFSTILNNGRNDNLVDDDDDDDDDIFSPEADALNPPTPMQNPQADTAVLQAQDASSKNWKNADNFRADPVDLTEALSQYTTNQLREMARVLGFKLKGTQKSVVVDAVRVGLVDYVAQIKHTPDALLQSLSPEQAIFARKLLTAFDVEGVVPRNISKHFLAATKEKILESDANKRLGALFESLTERGFLFQYYPNNPELRYRDVYYRWVPMKDIAHRVPVMQWPDTMLLSKRETDKLSPHTTKQGFLEQFEAFLEAVHASGAEWRQHAPKHAKTAAISWLQDWEHNADEVESILNSRRGWSPDGTSGISVRMTPHLTEASAQSIENQTGLSNEQSDLFFTLAAALQLLDRPENIQARLNSPIRIFLNSRNYETWQTLSPEEKLGRAWRAWTEQTVYASEVAHAVGKVEATANFKVMRAIGARDISLYSLGAEWCALRRFVVRALRGLPSQTWVSWPEFRKVLFELHPNASHMLHTNDQWWFSSIVSNIRFDQMKYDDWQKATGMIILRILTESLQWFGAVECDCAPSKSGMATNLRAFRITEVGKWLLEGLSDAPNAKLPNDAKPKPRAYSPIEWCGDFSWRVPPAPDRAALVTFSRMIGDPEGAPSTYTLTHNSIERALRHNITVNEFVAQFAQFKIDISAAAKTRFEQIAERYGQVRIYDGATVLQVADEITLRELLASTSLANFVIYQLSPRALVIDVAGVDELMREMSTQGHTPKLVE
ncbi:MAG: helicase-associated domain-containing protein [Anaerolineae bacterium]|nr:helicase-associated domain-containing protein [Anaerolineae bacterium]